MRAFHQELTEEFYSREVEVTFPSCAPDQTVKLSTLLGYAAAVGGADYDARGLPYKKLLELRQVFLLSRLSLRVHRLPILGNVLKLVTWEEGVQGVHMLRNCVMQDDDGTVAVSACSQWILVDPMGRKILRPSAFTARAIFARGKEVDAPPCRKLSLDAAGTPLGERRVVWSDLDSNGHVYSGNYGGIFWDALPAELQGRHFQDFSINYHKEAVLGEVLHLAGHQEGECFTIAGEGNGGQRFTASCTLRSEDSQE